MSYSNLNDTERSAHNDEDAANASVSEEHPGGAAEHGDTGEQSYREYARPDAYYSGATPAAPASNVTDNSGVQPTPASNYAASTNQQDPYDAYHTQRSAGGANNPSSVYPPNPDPAAANFNSGATFADHDQNRYAGYTVPNVVPTPPLTPPPVAVPTRKRKGGVARTLAITFLTLVLIAVFGTGLFAGWQFRSGQGTGVSGVQQVTVPPLTSTDAQSRREEVIARIRPAVVQLNVTTSQGSALGSGVIIDKRGYIVTNNHVVSGASTVDVVLSDGTSIKNAQVVGADAQDDLAIIKINPTSTLVAAPLGDSSQLKVGQDVMAIGSPLGNTQTVTSGIISALGRNVNEGQNGNGATLPGTIQTDAPINPGNSGGALVDLNGNLIGIPTLTAVDPEFNAPANGVGFAIPSNRVKFIADQLITTGKVSHTGRAAIGIAPVTVDQNLQAQGDLPANHGVLVYQLVSGGAAEKAGIKSGDVIVQIDGKAINSISDLEDALLAKNPGDSISVTVARGNQQSNQQVTMKVTLGELQATNR